MPSAIPQVTATNATKSPRIEQLAALISTNTSQITSHLRDNGLPFPSFDINAPTNLNLKPDVEQARLGTIDALQELLDLLKGPAACTIPYYNATSLSILHRFKLPHKIAIDETISFEELASRSGLRPDVISRTVRHASSFFHLFTEPKPGYVAHSAGSKLLVEDEVLFAGLGQEFEGFYPGYSKVAEALERWGDSEPEHTGHAIAHNTDLNIFDYIAQDPARGKEFALSMRCFTRDLAGNSQDFLVDGYDWKSMGSSTVVDVGGSDGYVSLAIAKANPDLKFVVQDVPDVLDVATQESNEVTKFDRISFQEYDFFTPQPLSADAYLYRWIFHDWPDHYVVRALQNLVPALKPGAKLIVNESLLPPPGSLPLTIERTICHINMLMLTINNSRLRTVPEWQKIFNDADPRFGPLKVTLPEGAALAIMEIVWQG